MDRDAIARGGRRKQLEDAIEAERGRQTALLEQLEELVIEADGGRVDEQAFARMEPDDVALVRGMLLEEPFDDGEDSVDLFPEPDDGGIESEIERLQAEIEGSQRRQRACERYLEALASASAPRR